LTKGVDIMILWIQAR